jgi:hypothetical protein
MIFALLLPLLALVVLDITLWRQSRQIKILQHDERVQELLDQQVALFENIPLSAWTLTLSCAYRGPQGC